MAITPPEIAFSKHLEAEFPVAIKKYDWDKNQDTAVRLFYLHLV